MKTVILASFICIFSLVYSVSLAAAKQDYCENGKHELAIHWLTHGKIEKNENLQLTNYMKDIWEQFKQKEYIGSKISITVHSESASKAIFDGCKPGCSAETGFSIMNVIAPKCEPMVARRDNDSFKAKFQSSIRSALNTTHSRSSDIFNQLLTAMQAIPKEKNTERIRKDFIIGRMLPERYLTRGIQDHTFDAAFVKFVQQGRTLTEITGPLSIKCTGDVPGTGAFWRDIFELFGHKVNIDCN
jgi:hypothetical protein